MYASSAYLAFWPCPLRGQDQSGPSQAKMLINTYIHNVRVVGKVWPWAVGGSCVGGQKMFWCSIDAPGPSPLALVLLSLSLCLSAAGRDAATHNAQEQKQLHRCEGQRKRPPIPGKPHHSFCVPSQIRAALGTQLITLIAQRPDAALLFALGPQRNWRG